MTITRRGFLAGASAAALAGPAIIGRAQAADTIRFVSILDQSGGLDIYGKPMADATRMAVDEINAAGGLLGREVELKLYDPQSTIQYYTQYATQAAAGDKADVVHAGITSASREAIRPTFSRFEVLYFYNTLYEGGVCDFNCFCTGSTPAQTVEKLVPYTMNKWGKKVYIVAADYNYGQITAQWVQKYVADNGGEAVETEFFPLDVTNFGPTIKKIQAAKPDMVMSALVGGAHVSFYRQYAAAGMSASVPIASTTFGVGNEHKLISAEEGNGMICAYSYFEEIDTPANRDFVARFNAYMGGDAAGAERAGGTLLGRRLAVGGGGEAGGHRGADAGHRGAARRARDRRPLGPGHDRAEDQPRAPDRPSRGASGPVVQHHRDPRGAAADRHPAGLRPGGRPEPVRLQVRERPGGGRNRDVGGASVRR